MIIICMASVVNCSDVTIATELYELSSWCIQEEKEVIKSYQLNLSLAMDINLSGIHAVLAI